MNKKITSIVSTILILVFGFFSVGVPVVQYLCPMMNGENPTCDMSMASGMGGLTISTETPSCCAKQLGAERNTTPFLKVEKVQTFSFAIIAAIPVADPVVSAVSAEFLQPSAFHSSSPLFLLNSALLI